ncbi:MAG: fasciclin domain-containing protein [Sphingomonas sp.]
MTRRIAKAPLIALIGAVALAGCATSNREEPDASASAPMPAKHAATSRAPTLGGATIDPAADIVTNAAKAPNLTIFVKALQAADLSTMLSGPGPYTVFAPTNDAFGRLAPGTVDTLLKPENKASLVKLLQYHVIAGSLSSKQLRDRIAAGGGTTVLTTVEGGQLTATLSGTIITLTDVNGNKSYIEASDVPQSNGIIHVVNGVMIPNLA